MIDIAFPLNDKFCSQGQRSCGCPWEMSNKAQDYLMLLGFCMLSTACIHRLNRHDSTNGHKKMILVF